MQTDKSLNQQLKIGCGLKLCDWFFPFTGAQNEQNPLNYCLSCAREWINTLITNITFNDSAKFKSGSAAQEMENVNCES
jgi:hypothetical protein